MKKTLVAIGMSLALLTACAPQQKENLTLSGLNPAKFETLVDGNKAVKLYTLKDIHCPLEEYLVIYLQQQRLHPED